MNLILLLTFCSLNFGFIKDSIIIRAGDNSKEVSQFIQESEQKGYKDWAEFLLASMPDVDLVNLKSDDFINYFDALKKNYKRVPWRNKIDENLFYFYILPHRVSQEPLENFTTDYADTLYNLVKNIKNMRDVVFRINEWVFTKMKYEPTEQWDQNATTTIKRGIGRCEEMSILFIKALRTVCIPCRHTYTPWWPFTNSNHAWVEVWVDGKWHSLGGGELTDLDNAWFRIPSQRAAIIKSIVYGEMAADKEIIDRKDTKFTIINSTPNYEDGVELNIQVKKNNIPVESAQVSINVYNYSSLVPVGSKKTDNNGCVKWVVGKTDLFVYVYKDTMTGYQIWRPLAKTNDTILIEISRREIPDTSFWLYTRKVSGQNPKSKYKPDNDKLKKLQDQHFKEIDVTNVSLSATLSQIDTNLINIFKDAKSNARPLLQFYFDLPDSLRDVFVDYFKRLVSKDIVELDTSGLYYELSAVLKSLSLAKKNTPDSIIKDYVFPSRVLYEHIGKWRTTAGIVGQGFSLTNPKATLKGRPILDKIVDSIFVWVEHNIEKKKDGDVFGPMMNPEDVYKTKRATDTERYVFIIGILRSQGIPARIKWSFDAVEYWDGQWKEKSFQQKQEKQNVWVGVKFSQDTIDVTQKINYYEDYSITRFKDNPNRLEPSIGAINGYQVITLDPEPSYLVTGWRNGFGDTYVRLKKIVPNLDTAKVITNIDIPEDVKPGDLMVREYKGFSGLDKIGIKSKDLENGDVLIIIFDNSEASSSTIINAKNAINTFQGRVFFFNVSGAVYKRSPLDIFGIKNSRIFYGTRDLDEKWGIQNLPSILYLKDSKTIFWIEGINLHLSRLLQNFQK